MLMMQTKTRRPRRTWTVESIVEELKKYPDKATLQREDEPLYLAAIRRRLHDVAFSHMAPAPNAARSDEELIETCKAFKTRRDLREHDESAYNLVLKRGLEEKAFAHMEWLIHDDWTPETVMAECQKYTTYKDLIKNSMGAYRAAHKLGIAPEALSHLKAGRHQRTSDEVIGICKQYLTRDDLRRKNNPVYLMAHRKGITEEAFEHMPKSCNESYEEKEIAAWLLSLGATNTKIRLGEGKRKKEIDIYLPDYKVGIEYCGLYWHNEGNGQKGKTYHFDKMKLVESHGVRLITIFEDEWVGRKDQVKNFLMSVVGLSDTKISARKCQLVPVDILVGRAFLEQHHIQGPARLNLVFFGLEFNGELIGVVSGGRHHRQGHKTELVLDRLCFKGGITVQGGASRLFKALVGYAQANGYSKVVSWSDNRWSQGNVYRKMGFILEQELGPDYSYVDISNPHRRYSKQSMKKKGSERTGNLTERELREAEGYSRIWDCGKKRWTFQVRNP